MKKVSKVKMGMPKKLIKAKSGYSVTSQTTSPGSIGRSVGMSIAKGMVPPASAAASSMASSSSAKPSGSRPVIPAPGAKKKQVTKERSDDGNYVIKEKKTTTPQGSKTVQKKRRSGLGFLRNAAYDISGGRIGQDVPRPMKKGGIVKKSKKK